MIKDVVIKITAGGFIGLRLAPDITFRVHLRTGQNY